MILVLKGGVICVLRATSSLKKVLGGGERYLSFAIYLCIYRRLQD